MAVYDDDRTKVWILRTQELKRTPAIRGGVSPDARARRQSAIAVAAAVIMILLVPLLSMLFGSNMQPELAVARVLEPATVRVAAAGLPPAPVLPPKRLLIDAGPAWRRYLAPWLPIDGTRVSGGRPAPFAPIWLDTHPPDAVAVTARPVPGAPSWPMAGGR